MVQPRVSDLYGSVVTKNRLKPRLNRELADHMVCKGVYNTKIFCWYPFLEVLLRNGPHCERKKNIKTLNFFFLNLLLVYVKICLYPYIRTLNFFCLISR